MMSLYREAAVMPGIPGLSVLRATPVKQPSHTLAPREATQLCSQTPVLLPGDHVTLQPVKSRALTQTGEE